MLSSMLRIVVFITVAVTLVANDVRAQEKTLQPDVAEQTVAQTLWSVTGVILEKGTRRPLANITVVINEHDDWFAVTDEDGSFTISVSESGDYTLSAIGIGYLKPAPLVLRLDADTSTQDVMLPGTGVFIARCRGVCRP